MAPNNTTAPNAAAACTKIRHSGGQVTREAGPVKGFDASSWFGLLAPAGTPAPVVAKLAAAQAQIATAAELAPRDPEVGLEAGVIAMLAGNEAAARKSWQSAIATAPASEAAATAKGYLAQLDASPQSKP